MLKLSLALAVALSAKNPAVLVELTEPDVESLDPAWAENMSPLFNVYEPLLAFKGEGTSLADLEPALSERVPTRANGLISADGRVYRFPIRRGVRFHDGTTLTAEDARYSLLRFMLLDRPGGPSAALLEPILGVSSTREGGKPIEGLYERAAEAVRVEDNALVVRLHRPFAPFLSIVANFGRVVSRRWCAAQGQWDGSAATWTRHNGLALQDALPLGAANGTGPFRLDRYDAPAKQFVFSRHDGYWRGPAKLEQVLLKVVPSFLTRRLMLQAGDADVIWADPLVAPQLREAPGVAVAGGLHKVATPKTLAFAFRTDPKPGPYSGSGQLDGRGVPPDFFADEDVRRGFAHAVDRRSIVEDVFRGHAVVSGLFPKGLPGHRAAPRLPPYDPKKAATHFRKAFGGALWEKGFTLTLPHVAGRESDQAIWQLLKRSIEALNPKFRLELRPAQSSTLLEQLSKRQVPLYFGGWTSDYPDPHDIAYAMLHSQGRFAQRNGYSDPEADRLIDAAAATLDAAERDRLYGRLEELLEARLWFVPLAAPTHFRVQRSWVRGFTHNPAVHGMPYMSYYYDLDKAGARSRMLK